MKKLLSSIFLMALSIAGNGQSLSTFNALELGLLKPKESIQLGLGTMNGRMQFGVGLQVSDKNSVHYSLTHRNSLQGYDFFIVSGNSKVNSTTHQLSFAHTDIKNDGKNGLEWQAAVSHAAFNYEERITSILGIASEEPLGVITETVEYEQITFSAAVLWHRYKNKRDAYVGLRTNHSYYPTMKINIFSDEIRYKSSGYKLPTIGSVAGINWQKGLFKVGCQVGVQFGESLQLDVDESYEFHGEIVSETSHVYYTSSHAYVALQLGYLLNSRLNK